MDKKIRFCLVGRGSIGTRHIRNLQFLGYNNIIAFSKSKDPDKDQEYLNTYQVRTLHSRNEIKKFNPDVFIIANPTSQHIEAAILALDLGAHIFMEKPLSSSLHKTSQLKQRLAPKNKIFLQANCLRFHPAIKKIKSLIERNKLGKIYFARIQAGQFLPDWHPEEDYRKTYAGKKSLGGGVALTLQHEIDYAYWFLGKFSRVKSLSSKVSDLEIDIKDVASIILQTEQGALVEIHLDYLQRPASRSVHIQGSLGSINYIFGDEVMKFFDFEKRIFIPVLNLKNYNINQMYLEELKHFIACIKGRVKPLIPFSDALYTLQICLKIR